ncbi:LacI family DNA-binding transcriptional regulator, partial [Streptomyces sp. NPDC006265]
MDAVPARPARIQDVAAAAGVSVSTVSNVLNRPERVNARTAE